MEFERIRAHLKRDNAQSKAQDVAASGRGADAGHARANGIAYAADSLAFKTLGRKIAKTRISETEAVALEAGDVSIERGYFDGRPKWDEMRSLPAAKLSDEERLFIDGQVSTLASRVNPVEINKLKDLPPDVWNTIRKSNILGAIIEKKYGGLGFSPTAHSEMLIKLGSMSTAAVVSVMVPNSLGPGELLMRYGTEAQKDKWLPRLADGTDIPCFALTSITGGSDATGGMINSGTVFRGDDGRLKVRMDISNRYITLAPVATLAGIAFKLKDPKNLLGKGPEPGITIAIVPRDTPNLIMGPRHNPMDVPFQNGTIRGRNVVIDIEENIIGGGQQVGNGWKMLMESLSVGRSISLPGLSTTAGKVASQYVGSYARIRRQFNTEISNFQGVDEALARIAGYTYIMDSARRTTLQMLEDGKKPTIPSAIIKYHLTEMMRKVCNDGMDILAGSGVMNGPRNVLADLYKAAPIAITVEGANIMTRTFIIFGQGLMRAHPNLYPMIKAAKEEDSAEFGRLFRKHVGDMTRYFVSSELGIGSNAGIPEGVPKEIKKYYRQINRLSAGFAFSAAVISGIYQDKLKSEEDISKRLGDVLSNLYLATSVLNRFEQDGMQKGDLPLVHWSCQHLIHNVDNAFRDLMDNFPSRPVAWLLKDAVLSRRSRYKGPDDRLGREVARILTSPSETKERLTAGIYRPRPGETFVYAKPDGSIADTGMIKPQAMLEDTLPFAIASEPVEMKLAKVVRAAERAKMGGSADNGSKVAALVNSGKADNRGALLSAALADGILSRDEFDLLRLVDNMRNEVLQVDTFTQNMTLLHRK